jgi:hypothetical protein
MTPRWTLLAALACLWLAAASCQEKIGKSATVPMVLDHNRMIVEAEIQRQDGTWRTVRLWIDTGNPDFFMNEALARDLGIDLSAMAQNDSTSVGRPLTVPPPKGVRIGDMALNFDSVNSKVMVEPKFLFSATGADANLPSTVLQKYGVVFDYPKREFTIAEPGSLKPQGERVPAAVNRQTGIVQVDAAIGSDSMSFALDIGASYSFVSAGVFDRLAQNHPDWPRTAGAVGCANMWGWWPDEPNWPVMRVAEIDCQGVKLGEVGLIGLPNFFANGSSLGDWYSRKTARPVVGFLGPNALKAFRVEIDYADSAVYFEKGADFDSQDMDLVGLTIGQDADGAYLVIGVTQKDGKPAVEGVMPGDKLLKVGAVEATGATMGKVVDALRGQPGETRTLLLDRAGQQITVDAKVEHWL